MNDDVDIRVRLQGGKVVAAEARAVATEVDAIGDSAQRSGTRLRGFADEGKRVRPMLAGISRAASTAALYTGGFAAAVGGFATFTGLKFNATMEQNSVAFAHFLGNTQKAHRYLGELYKVAAHTPFEFEGLVSGARKFLAFGFRAKEAKQLLQEIGDTAAGLGGGTEEIERMVLAIGQMKAKGKIQAEELMQLNELGVPAQRLLAEGLGMSGEQIAETMQKGELQFTQGIKALRAGMRREFGGMSKEQAKTFNGQLSTLKDNTVQAMGRLTKPVFDWLKRDVLPALNGALPGIQKWLKGALAKLPEVFDAIKGGASDFIGALKPAQPLWENVLWPFLKGFGIGLAASVIGAVKVAVPVLKGLMVVLGAVGTVLAPLKGVFQAVGTVVSFVFGGTILKAIGALGKFEGILGLVGKAATVLSWPIRVVGRGVLFVAGTLGRLWLRFSPVGILLRNLPGLLQRGVGAFTSFGAGALSAIKGAVGKIVGLFGSLPGKVAGVGGKMWHTISEGFARAVGSGLGFAGGIGKSIANSMIHFINTAFPDNISMPGPVPDIDLPNNPIPELANGGILRRAGSVIVGDAGPEVLSLPRGARVDPLPRLAMAGGAGGAGGGDFHFTIPVVLDGREVGRAVERYATEKQNRR